nr:GNAT family N-acetyltransferase [Pseudooceanicola aestuarii]
MRIDWLTGPALEAALEDVARLRIAVFRDWPYLYDGDLDYERGYLRSYLSPGAIVVAAFDDTGEGAPRMVGAATGAPMEDHAADFAAAFAHRPEALTDIFYCAESVLLPEWRGQGVGHAFFDAREAHARRLGRHYAAFCAVARPDSHPQRPACPRDLTRFWRGRGYAPLPDCVAQFRWRDIGAAEETPHDLQFWMKPLEPAP